MQETGVPLSRVVAVVARLADGRDQVGSGYLVADALVLTAGHCSRDMKTRAEPIGLAVVRASDGATAEVADVVAAHTLDLAVLRVAKASWAAVPASVFGRVD